MTGASGDLTAGDLDVTPVWLRARRCDVAQCVEVAHHGGQVLVRDSKDPERVLTFSGEEWATFLDGVYSGDFAGVPGA